MTIKEELEILRGEPIVVFDGNPMDIPCIETSDCDKLCKHPVVSVHMITYNHEPYIRQAIEGVLMQKTDFEYELVIGEDCSQDRTREICLEYQKKFPDKIRVLWWYENVTNLGGNARRVSAHCRGDFIAFCEGDDYWIDPMKLQKQVEAMRRHPSAGICFCDARMYYQSEDRFEDRLCAEIGVGLIPGRKFLLYHLFGKDPSRDPGDAGFVMTATVMVRMQAFLAASKEYEVFKWGLWLGDKVLLYGVSSLFDVIHLEDKVSVYRRASTGIMTTRAPRVLLDSALLRMYFPTVVLKLNPFSLPEYTLFQYVSSAYGLFMNVKLASLVRTIFGVFRTRFRSLLFRRRFTLFWVGLHIILVEQIYRRVVRRLSPEIPWRVPRAVVRLYKTYNKS